MVIGIHAVTATRREIFDEAQAKGATAVLVPLKLGNGGLRSVCIVEADDTTAARSAAWFVLNLGLFNLTDGGKEFNEILVACRPWELGAVKLGPSRIQSGRAM